MCTVSWLQEADGYQLFCNRDEKRTRAQGSGPHVETREGVQYIAPIDGNFGGSWIAVNEHGVSVCLLNGKPSEGTFTSRGLLLLSLISAASSEEAIGRLGKVQMEQYAPFTLTALMAGAPARIARWDGANLEVSADGQAQMPLISSSFDLETVQQRRTAEFARRKAANQGVVDERLLEAFHGSHANGPDAYSTCMHRPDAETVSFSRIRVSRREVEFYFVPGALCKGREGEWKRMERK